MRNEHWVPIWRWWSEYVSAPCFSQQITLKRGGNETTTNPSFKNPRETSVLRQKIYEDKVERHWGARRERANLKPCCGGWGCRSRRKAASPAEQGEGPRDGRTSYREGDGWEEGAHICFHPDSSGANAPSLTGNQKCILWINQTRQA